MDRHHARIGRRRDACGHRLDHAVDRLIAAHAKDCRAEDRVRVAVDHDLYEPSCLAFLYRAGYARHRPIADPDHVAFGAGLGFCQTDPAERRIDIERVGRNAVAHAAVGAVEQVRRGDFVIVV